MPTETTLLTTLENGVLRIRLNRPEKRNALNRQLVDELRGAVVDAASGDVDAIVIEGEGSVFCAGADLAYLEALAAFSVEENVDDSRALADALLAVYRSPVPVIARVHGHAIAGGCGLATACDIVVAVESAKFGYSEVGIGFIPAIVTALLLRKGPQIQTRELLLTGKLVTAAEARDRGIVTTIVPDIAELDAEIDRICGRLREADRGAVRMTKEMLLQMEEMTLEGGAEYGVRMNAIARTRAECREGIAQFLRKA
jgi:methylglutaconyl-CoA hydratase